MNREIPKAYDSKEVEDGIYKRWEDSGKFDPDNLDLPKNAKSFVISMPPPNATGVLHLGHASMLAYQDLMIRYNRLNGKKALWLPGTDHASIATQTRVEKLIAKEGKTKYDLGREKFLEHVDKFVEESRHTIKNQTKKMGSSCDWSRERYTLDDGLSHAVREVFVKMYNDGLIYRGDRIVNWCPRCESTLADDEVEHKDQKAKLYYFRYSKEFPITIASTRPETKLGDTAVAVNPKDERYRSYIGKTYEIDLGNGVHKIKIIADHEVDMTFGTGALGVTPAHSMADWQMAEKNDLEIIKIIDERGKMKSAAGKDYEGLTVLEAREKFSKYIEEKGLIEKIEEVDQSLSICYRCDAPIEPLPSKQWFVDVDKKITIKGNKYFKNKSLKEVSVEVIKSGEIKIIPERFEKTYYHWMENLRDWCISRQLWFGHRIPVYYKSKVESRKWKVEKAENTDEKIYVGVEAPEGDGWMQDSDTLDTWFSSGLWTFSTLLDQTHSGHKTLKDWIADSPDIKKYHPTSVMETGYDILFFWVARMILMTTYVLGEVPFENVYLHGMVRDKQGRKMSKSLGNGIDPIEMIGKYGTDALRLSMIIGATPGNDIKLYEEKIESYRNFVNKLWNISRYILMSVTEVKRIRKAPKAKTLADRWILAKLDDLVGFSTDNLEKYNFSAVGERLYEFTWNDFADWYIEISKVEKNKDEILLYVLERLLIMWHPFMPFATEEIWKNFASDRMLMVEKWPAKSLKKASSAKDLQEFGNIKEIVTAIRNLRSENKIEPKKKIKAVISAKKRESLLKDQIDVIRFLAGLSELEMVQKMEKMKNAVSAVVSDCDIYIPMEGLVDFEKETENIKKEIENINAYLQLLGKKLNNAGFVSNAPKEVVEKERLKYASAEEKLKKLIEKRDSLL